MAKRWAVIALIGLWATAGGSTGGEWFPFDWCLPHNATCGLRGHLWLRAPGTGGNELVRLEPCGSRPCSAEILGDLQGLFSLALGPLDVTAFASPGTGQAELYLSNFARAAAAKILNRCQEDADVCHAPGNASDVSIERAIVDGLAAAGDHAALARVTAWMRENEKDLEWTSLASADRSACLQQGELHGYECHTFTYGSTFFHSWLQVMRFPAVAAALRDAASSQGRGRSKVVVLGSSLGWQTIWASLTFGLPSLGYELMEHRVDAARRAAALAGEQGSRIEFRATDAVASDISEAAVIYLTDLIWEDFLCTSVAAHIRQELLGSEDQGRGVVIISNKFERFKKMRFAHLGSEEVPVSWLQNQAFHFWSVRASGR